MKIFLSWSGAYSREIAGAFEGWIPSVIQSVEVFISTGGIGPGERWLPKISGALDEIEFGLVFVTEQNKEAPWLMFEAGALAKNVEKSRVIPVLCNAEDDIEFKKNPLSHFQYVKLDQDGIFRAMKSIFDVSEDTKLTEQLFEKGLQTWWPELQSQLNNIHPPKVSPKRKGAESEDRLGQLEGAVSQLIGEVRSLKSGLQNKGSERGIKHGPLAGAISDDGALSQYKPSHELIDALLGLRRDQANSARSLLRTKEEDGDTK
jgi:hypothetical protein